MEKKTKIIIAIAICIILSIIIGIVVAVVSSQTEEDDPTTAAPTTAPPTTAPPTTAAPTTTPLNVRDQFIENIGSYMGGVVSRDYKEELSKDECLQKCIDQGDNCIAVSHELTKPKKCRTMRTSSGTSYENSNITQYVKK